MLKAAWWGTTATFFTSLSELRGAGTTCSGPMVRRSLRCLITRTAVALSIVADPANPNATVAEWSPNVEYYTLDNTMTIAAKGETAHPGLERDARQHAGACVWNGPRGASGQPGGRRSGGVYGRRVQGGAARARNQGGRRGHVGASLFGGDRPVCRRALHAHQACSDAVNAFVCRGAAGRAQGDGERIPFLLPRTSRSSTS